MAQVVLDLAKKLNASFNHVSRAANGVAGGLAKEGVMPRIFLISSDCC